MTFARGVSAMPNLYNFPACVQAEQSSIDHQVRKVEEEADELWDEIARSPRYDARILEETWDVIHAAEGVLRKYTIHEVYNAMKAVEAKNQERGYYG